MSQKQAGAFGDTRKLPGHSGYKMSEAEALDREAKEMEQRLKTLQDRMQQQQMEDEAVPKFGGSRWKSARPDKGSVLSYAKDVQEKYRKKNVIGEDPIMRKNNGPSGPRTSSQKERAAVDFKNKDVEFWSVSDVSEWLSSAQLYQYAAAFIANEISGLILLDITLDDLDYMGISILGHRKIILKSIEDLRENKRITLNLVATHDSSNKSLPVPAAPIESVNQKTESKTKNPVHWSHLEALSTHQVSGNGSSSSVNAADIDSNPDVLDEAAEAAAFKEAVAGWRGSGGKVQIVREFKPNGGDAANIDVKGAADGGGQTDDSMWKNPFGTPLDDSMEDDDQHGYEDSERALEDSKKTKPALSTGMSTLSKKSFHPSPYMGEASLAHGALDEASEHEEFVKAVDAWRNRGIPSPKKENTLDSEKNKALKAGPSRSGASASALALAAKIAKDLEIEEEEFSKLIQSKREAFEAAMKVKIDTGLISTEDKGGDTRFVEDSMIDYDEATSDCDLKSKAKISIRVQLESLSKDSCKKTGVSLNDSKMDSVHDEKKGSAPSPTSCRVVPHLDTTAAGKRGSDGLSLESKTGLSDSKTELQDEDAYYVDEGSDED